MAPKFSEAELEMLTEEERQGLLDEDIVDEGLEGEGDGDESDGDDGDAGGDAGAEADGADQDAGDGDTADADADAGTEGGDAAAADAAAAAAAAAAASADTGDIGAEEEAEQERPAAWILPAEVNDKITALDAERDKLAEQFDDGELSAKEYREKLKPIEAEMDDLKQQRTTANTLRDIAITDYKEKTVPDFLKDNPQYKPGSLLYKMLDDEVRKLQQGSRDPLNPKHLRKAHETISEQLRAALGDTGGGKRPDPKTPPKTPPKREVPPTLAGVPSADITDADDGGEFAYLDRLAAKNVVEYEKELAKLPDHKRDQYLAQ